ncbi:MAG TPA: hypothetical protein VNA57_01970 [Acidimicrobiales bacterium]|nr:hypothetical protein [Acidimicrobiales bacterium]
MRLRTFASAALAIALSLGTVGPSLAQPADKPSGARSAEKAKPARAEAKQRREEAKARKAEGQARRKARFVAVGMVSDVSAASITLVVKGGSSRQLRGKTQSFAVPADANVMRNGQKVPLSAIQKGDKAMVKGAKTGDTYTARKVRAQSREPKPAS